MSISPTRSFAQKETPPVQTHSSENNETTQTGSSSLSETSNPDLALKEEHDSLQSHLSQAVWHATYMPVYVKGIGDLSQTESKLDEKTRKERESARINDISASFDNKVDEAKDKLAAFYADHPGFYESLPPEKRGFVPVRHPGAEQLIQQCIVC